MSNVLKYTRQNNTPVLIKPGEIIRKAADLPDAKNLQDPAVLADMQEELKNLRAHAMEIIAEAKTKAAEIMDEACQEAELLKQQSQKEGHKLGYKEGFENGKNVSHAQMRDSIDEAVRKAEGILTEAESQAKKMIFEANDEIIEITKAAIQRALCQEVLSNPEYITAVVKDALDKVRDHEQIVVRVHPWNFDLLIAAKHELQKILGREYDLAINADKTVARGGCVIDTSNGSVDASLDTKLELLAKVLEDVKEIEKGKILPELESETKKAHSHPTEYI